MNGDLRIRIRITRAGTARALLLCLVFGIPGLLVSQPDTTGTRSVTLNMGFPAPVGTFAQLTVGQDVSLLATGGVAGTTMFGNFGDLGSSPFVPPTGFILAGPAVLGQPQNISGGAGVQTRFNNTVNIAPVNGNLAGAALAMTDQAAGNPPWIIQAQPRPNRAPREALWFATLVGGVANNAFGIDDQGKLLIAHWAGPGTSCSAGEFSAYNGVGSIWLDGDLIHYCDEVAGCDVSDAGTAKLCVPFKVVPPGAGGW